VIFGSDGALYGTTQFGGNQCSDGGCGTVFKLNPSGSICGASSCPWAERVLYAFLGGADGQHPDGDLVFDLQGNIYGTTWAGGRRCNPHSQMTCGTVFQLAPGNGNWAEHILYEFGVYGNPTSGVVLDSGGNIYGAVPGATGAVYKLTNSSGVWTESTLHVLDGEGRGGLVIDGAGHLYGTTETGGSNGGGTSYELQSDGTGFDVLYNFSGASGGPLDTLAMDNTGNLYGTTNVDGAYGYGSVFELSPSNGGWTYTDLYDFTGGSDGGYPSGSVALGGNGNLYGTTTSGGSGNGVVWEITR